MLRWLRNKKGVSIVEIIVGIAVIGVISIPLTTMYINALKTSKMTMGEMEDNAVVWIVKENIKEAVKTGAAVFGNEGDPADISDDKKLVDAAGQPCTQNGLLVADSHTGNTYEVYQFDVAPENNAAYPGVAKLLVTVKKTNQGATQNVRQFRLEVNFLSIN